MKALVLRVGDDPKLEDIPDDGLRAVQDIVGGWVEQTWTPLDPNAAVLCNEDGLMKRLPHNAAAYLMLGRDLVGDVVVVGDGDNAWTDVPPALLNRMGLWPWPYPRDTEEES